MNTTTESGAAIATKLSPPAAVLGAHIAGIPVAEWIQWLTLIYLLMLVGHKAFQIGRDVIRHFDKKT